MKKTILEQMARNAEIDRRAKLETAELLVKSIRKKLETQKKVEFTLLLTKEEREALNAAFDVFRVNARKCIIRKKQEYQ